jgi:hypothetical protein
LIEIAGLRGKAGAHFQKVAKPQDGRVAARGRAKV